MKLFGPYDKTGCIKNTLEKDITETEYGALIEFYKKLKPGEPSTKDSARALVYQLFFNPKRYDLGKVGRYKLNKKLDVDQPLEQEIEDYLKIVDEKMGIDTTNPYLIHSKDIFLFVRYILQLMDGVGEIDDIDHFGNRRVRNVGELIQNQVRIGLARMERVVKERMTTQDIRLLLQNR